MNPDFYIKRPKFAVIISVVITLLGLLAAVVIPVDQFPEISPPKVVVRALYPGADTQTVIDTVAAPIEREVNGAEGMVYMSSKSASDGSYTLTVTFEVGTDPDLAQVDVQNRVALAMPTLPREVRERGVVTRKRNPDILMVANIVSPDERFDRVFLSNFASINVVGELGRVPGVGEASIIGALDYGMRAWLDPVQMANRGLGVNEVIAAIREQNLQAAVGQLGAAPSPDSTQFQYVLTAQGRVTSEEEFGDIILKADQDGSVVRLRDIARVELDSQGYRGYGEFNNKPGVLIAIYKISGANSIDVAKDVRTTMEDLSQFFPEGVDYVIGHDTTLFITASLAETVETLILTIALVVIVTYLFLGSARATLIPTLSVPVSIIGTFAVLQALGMSINTVSLFAMILAIGIVVDNAIIVVENVERILHDEPDAPITEVVRKAMSEITGPIVATTLVLTAVFVPTMFLPGMTGRMFAQFGMTLVISVLISMVNALTLGPALAVLVMRRGEKPNAVIRGFNRFFDWITRGYLRIVEFLIDRLALASLLTLAMFAGVYFLFTLVPQSFVPNEDKGFFLVDVQLPEAASLNRTEAVMDEIVERMKQDPAIENVLSVNGYSILNTALQSNSGMIIAKLRPWEERTARDQHQFALQQKYQAAFATMPQAQVLVFGAPAIPGLGAIAGTSFVLQDTAARPPAELGATATELIGAFNARPEIARAFTTFRSGAPQIRLEIDRLRAKTLGVRISDIFLTLQTQLGGLYVNDFNLYGLSYRVLIQADHDFRQGERDLDKFYVTNVKGELVPLSAVLRTEPALGPGVMTRHNSFNAVNVTGVPNVPGGFSSGDAMDAQELTALAMLPEGYRFAWTDSSFEERGAGNAVPIALALSLVFSYLFLAALYESFLTPIAVMLPVPIAIIGTLVGPMIGGQPLSLYGQVGVLMIIALTAKTSILIVEFGKQQRETEKLDLREAAMSAARLRFRPVMMTIVAFLFGVFPLVVASGAGAESRVSLGLVVFAGSLASALACAIMGPVFFKAVQGLREKLHGGPTAPVA
ncbi:efflux RND transporter permease subunit [Seohaeicola saemankumensis]|nr:efflux RND transporter permease subunit [Seohaeicola saemankumensis]MCA0871469.1 efflux RND transporter permease subunit [Seohaeicola saemankumensis]